MKNKLNLLVLGILFLNLIPVYSETNNKKKSKKTAQFKREWKYVPNQKKINKIIWEKLSSEKNKNSLNIFAQNKKKLKIRSLGKSVKVNDKFYPEISNYVPNAFVSAKDNLFNVSIRAISKTRSCEGKNFSSKCSDGVLDIGAEIIRNENFSFSTKYTIQSLTNRGTNIGEATSMGFRASRKLSSTNSIAIGGENIIHFDNKVDLGRNFYIVASSYFELAKKNNDYSMIFINYGIGSDFFGYGGNGTIGKTSCLGSPNLTGNGTNMCNWGFIASIALALNSRLSLVHEWFGYGYGTGISYRPLKNMPISFSLYATDYLNKKNPSYIIEKCPKNSCSTRLYGSINLSF